jgi:hypothetical protein
MKDLPLEHREKISIVVLLTSYARIYSLLRRDMERAAQTGANSGPVSGLDYGAALEHLVTQERFPYLRPLILAGAYSAEEDGGDAHPYGFEFDFGLARVLDGIGQYVAAKEG